MSSHLREVARVIDIGPLEWCWLRLGDAADGMLSCGNRGERFSLAVEYAITEQLITILMPADNPTAWWSVKGEVTLEVTGSEADQRWVVRATGPTQRIEPGGTAASRQRHPSAQSGSTADQAIHSLVLPAARVRGFFETPVFS